MIFEKFTCLCIWIGHHLKIIEFKKIYFLLVVSILYLNELFLNKYLIKFLLNFPLPGKKQKTNKISKEINANYALVYFGFAFV